MTIYQVIKAVLPVLVSFFAVSGHAHEDANESEFGVVNFDISCAQETQATFNHAVAQLHNMMYVQAEQMFNDAAIADPECAMLHWGVAMTNFHPLWPGGQNEAELERGSAAVARALEIGTETPREDAYVRAAAAMYEIDVPYRKRLEDWSKIQQLIYENHPDDIDASALYALSQLAVTPKADKTMANQKRVGLLLEKLHTDYPEHPAGFHYLIHAYDNPLLASKAETVSRTYDKIAPAVPHALHMPSHIFVRMGLWEETVFWNDRSAKAALDLATAEQTQSHYAHAVDYQVYAHLQRGESDNAAEIFNAANEVTNHQSSFGSAYGLAAAAARVPLETEDWEAATALSVRDNSAIDWDKFPAAVAITHFAKGIGAARGGNMEATEQSIAELTALRDHMQDNGPAYWAIIADSQVKSVSGWLALAQDDKNNAVSLMQAAADLEDSVDKSPVTPSAVLPARELLGDMLSLLGKPGEALVAYETALSIGPNRRRSMLGAMDAAVASGDSEKAQLYKQAIGELSASNDWMRQYVVTVDAKQGAIVAQSQLAAAGAGSGNSLKGSIKCH